MAEASGSHAVLTCPLGEGEAGLPGERLITATFRVEAPATLTLELTGTTDAPTLMNLANHSYWNLDGTADWSGHSLRIGADHYLPTDDDFVVTGEIATVAGTRLDLREGRTIAPRDPAIDHNFCLSDGAVDPRDVLWLTGQSGLSLTIATDRPGIQVYDGRHAVRPGRAAYEGLAIEAQDWPDAPSYAAFPTIRVTPDAPYRQHTRWRFTRPGD